MDLVRPSRHLKGANVDIRIIIYSILEYKQLHPVTIKGKNHAATV